MALWKCYCTIICIWWQVMLKTNTSCKRLAFLFQFAGRNKWSPSCWEEPSLNVRRWGLGFDTAGAQGLVRGLL